MNKTAIYNWMLALLAGVWLIALLAFVTFMFTAVFFIFKAILHFCVPAFILFLLALFIAATCFAREFIFDDEE